MKPVGIYKISEKAQYPERATEYSACYDVRACFHKDKVKINGNIKIDVRDEHEGASYIDLLPMDRVLVPTGMIFLLPKNTKLCVRPRSGLAFHNGIMVANSTGIIDEDYTNETFVLLINMSKDVFRIKDGDRIAQLEFEPATASEYEFGEVSLSHVENAREGFDRKGGIGHTGVK